MNLTNILSAAFASAIWISSASATTLGSVIAIGDEWTLSDVAFDGGSFSGDFFAGDRPNAEALSANLASQLGGANYTIATVNAFAYGSDFETYLTTSQGKSVNRVNTSAALNAALATSDAVFLAGTIGTGSLAALNSFVANGGSVVVSLGTGNQGTPGAEAAAWNPFLSGYGLQAS